MDHPIIAVLTGDIVHSRQGSAVEWLGALKGILGKYGRSPSAWDIYRGDSFQLAVAPERALRAALHLKAGLRSMDRLDVRIGIGIGEWSYHSDRITEAGGTAFVRSGEAFARLKKRTLLLDTGHDRNDETLNLMLELASLTMDRWTPNVAGTILTAMEHPYSTQTEIAAIMEKAQSGVSEALGRGGFEEITHLLEYFERTIRESWPSC